MGNQAAAGTVVVNNCYWSGKTNTKGRTGTFRGGVSTGNNNNQLLGGITLTNAFYNKELFTLSVPASVSGTGLATSEFSNSSNFVNWDFKEDENDTEYTWYMGEDGYPELHFNN